MCISYRSPTGTLTRAHRLSVATLFALALLCGSTGQGQQLCRVREAHLNAVRSNIFSAQQEVELGDVEAEWLEKTYRVLAADGLSAHLNAIESRILAQFPANPGKVRIILIDTPEADSFSAGSERIYITRKMVKLLHNDDELAGLLAHELEHMRAHQNAVTVTQTLHDVLGVDAVGDRNDISDKLNRMLDPKGRKKNALWAAAQRIQRQEAGDQYQADRVALCASASAGFSPQAYLELFDRFAQTHGKTGNFLTDFIGATTANQKRLREMHKSLNALPRSCREGAHAGVSAEFLAWQADVLAYPSLSAAE